MKNIKRIGEYVYNERTSACWTEGKDGRVLALKRTAQERLDLVAEDGALGALRIITRVKPGEKE